MSKVKLTGKSGHGKNRIREHGELWTVIKEFESIACLDMKAGLFIQSEKTHEKRWIAKSNDKHFKAER